MGKNLIEQAVDILKDYCLNEFGGNKSAMSKAVGINPASGLLGKWFEGERVPSLSKVAPILEQIGVNLSFPGTSATIRRPGCNAPIESVEGESLPSVPVYGSTGAGAAADLFTGEPETLIQVLPQYNLPGVAALRVEGDSMEPTVRRGSYVGVVPFSGDISEGGIYLVHMPPFGRVIKRIRMGANGSIELHSDNKIYQPIPLPFEGYEEIVRGKVVWIWQLC